MNSEDLNALLDRNIGFINNCDTKTSVGLAVNGVMMSVVLNALSSYENDRRILYVMPLVLLLMGAVCFIYTLRARYENRNDEMKTLFWNYQLCVKSGIEKLDGMSQSELISELKEQIVVNAILAKRKYKWYNDGLFCTSMGSIVCIFIVLSELL